MRLTFIEGRSNKGVQDVGEDPLVYLVGRLHYECKRGRENEQEILKNSDLRYFIALTQGYENGKKILKIIPT